MVSVVQGVINKAVLVFEKAGSHMQNLLLSEYNKNAKFC
jgi:hypothetical protein